MRNWRMQASDMVEEQIIGRDVHDERILKIMTEIPRHLFVPEEHSNSAYIDRPLPIGQLQTISQPYMVAKMTELLAVQENMKILEIGTGSGYQAAVLAALGLRVWSIERVSTLAEKAQKTLSALGLDITVLHGDGREGHQEAAPYERLIVTAASSKIEPAWDDQLAVNGLMVIPLDVKTGGQRLLVRQKLEHVFFNTWYDYCRFVPILTGTD